jgi:hypothetical protein
MAATAFTAHSFSKYQAEARALRIRDYSSPEKWVEPKYASLKDMEAVSLAMSHLESFGRLGTVVPLAELVGWLRRWDSRVLLGLFSFSLLSNRYAFPV